MSYKITNSKIQKKPNDIINVCFLNVIPEKYIFKTIKSKTNHFNTKSETNHQIEMTIYISHFPLTFEEQVIEAENKLKKMTLTQRKKLAKKACGAWENYPDDWFNKIIEGILSSPYDITTESDYVLSS